MVSAFEPSFRMRSMRRSISSDFRQRSSARNLTPRSGNASALIWRASVSANSRRRSSVGKLPIWRRLDCFSSGRSRRPRASRFARILRRVSSCSRRSAVGLRQPILMVPVSSQASPLASTLWRVACCCTIGIGLRGSLMGVLSCQKYVVVFLAAKVVEGSFSQSHQTRRRVCWKRPSS